MEARAMRLATFRKVGLSLVPIDADARMIMAEIPDGKTGIFEYRKPRNAKQHRAYFAMLNNVVEASGLWSSREALEFELAWELKRGHIVELRNGKRRFEPDSRAVASMKKDDFERLHKDTVALLTEWLGCSPEALFEEAA